MPTETDPLMIQCDEDLKGRLSAAALAENRDVASFVLQAIKLRLNTVCSHCGRSERPAAAGLSDAFAAFLDEITKTRDMQPVCVTAMWGDRPIAYRGRIDLLTASEGFVLLLVPFLQGKTAHVAECCIPRGLITGWQHDNEGDRYRRLVRMGYVNGNDHVIGEWLGSRPMDVVTVRAVLEAVCARPDMSRSALREYARNPSADSTIDELVQYQLILSNGGILLPALADADSTLQAARARGFDLDKAMG